MRKYIHYKVCWGDTLDSIAKKYNLSLEDIKYINDINDIYVGKVLFIPVKYPLNNKNKEIKVSLIHCFKRHIKKRHLFNYMDYKKSHQV